MSILKLFWLISRTENYFGRRRPYIGVGHIVTACGMALIAVCTLLGELLGDNPQATTPYGHVASIAFAVSISFIFLTSPPSHNNLILGIRAVYNEFLY